MQAQCTRRRINGLILDNDHFFGVADGGSLTSKVNSRQR